MCKATPPSSSSPAILFGHRSIPAFYYFIIPFDTYRLLALANQSSEKSNMSLMPPSVRDGWSYSGDFHVEASGNNRHRRATIPELKAVFDGTDGQKDRPAHWYEAQLIHYGLPPSKTKGTAKMRPVW